MDAVAGFFSALPEEMRDPVLFAIPCFLLLLILEWTARLTDDVAPQPMSSDFEKIRQEFGFPGDDRVVTKCFLLWAGVVGAISLEVFGQYGADMLTDPGVVFDAQTRLLVAVLASIEAAAIGVSSRN